MILLFARARIHWQEEILLLEMEVHELCSVTYNLLKCIGENVGTISMTSLS